MLNELNRETLASDDSGSAADSGFLNSTTTINMDSTRNVSLSEAAGDETSVNSTIIMNEIIPLNRDQTEIALPESSPPAAAEEDEKPPNCCTKICFKFCFEPFRKCLVKFGVYETLIWIIIYLVAMYFCGILRDLLRQSEIYQNVSNITKLEGRVKWLSQMLKNMTRQDGNNVTQVIEQAFNGTL